MNEGNWITSSIISLLQISTSLKVSRKCTQEITSLFYEHDFISDWNKANLLPSSYPL